MKKALHATICWRNSPQASCSILCIKSSISAASLAKPLSVLTQLPQCKHWEQLCRHRSQEECVYVQRQSETHTHTHSNTAAAYSTNVSPAKTDQLSSNFPNGGNYRYSEYTKREGQSLKHRAAWQWISKKLLFENFLWWSTFLCTVHHFGWLLMTDWRAMKETKTNINECTAISLWGYFPFFIFIFKVDTFACE